MWAAFVNEPGTQVRSLYSDAKVENDTAEFPVVTTAASPAFVPRVHCLSSVSCPTSAHDLPSTVAVSVGNLPLYRRKPQPLLITKDNKVPHLNMSSGYSSLGMADKGAGRTEACREVRVMEESRLRDGQENTSEAQQNLAQGADEFATTLLQVTCPLSSQICF